MRYSNRFYHLNRYIAPALGDFFRWCLVPQYWWKAGWKCFKTYITTVITNFLHLSANRYEQHIGNIIISPSRRMWRWMFPMSRCSSVLSRGGAWFGTAAACRGQCGYCHFLADWAPSPPPFCSKWHPHFIKDTFVLTFVAWFSIVLQCV